MPPTLQDLIDTAWVRLAPSNSGGVGVFAIRDIPAGTEVNRGYNGRVHVTIDDLNQLDEGLRDLLMDHFTLMDDHMEVLSPSRFCNYWHYYAHSRNPNFDNERTLRDIKRGEELTVDYRLVKGRHLKAAEFI